MSRYRVLHNTHRGSLTALFFILFSLCLSPATAQEEEVALNWIYGPNICPLGSVAEINLPAGYQFVDGDGTRLIMEWLENPTDGRELGMVMPEPTEDSGLEWFVVFDFDPIGYVKDDEKDELDADAIIQSITEGTEQANQIRRERGWEEVHVLGWHTPPFYDERSNNLTWAIIGGSTTGQSVNLSTRVLGRGGAMSADLVVGDEDLALALDGYGQLIEQLKFTSGHRYAEFREGDKVAKYGLTALIAGGAGAVAMKTGLLARFWKFIVFGLIAVLSAARRFLGRFLGGGKKEAASVQPTERVEVEAIPVDDDPKDRDGPR